MPKTKERLDELVETTKSYQLRRVKLCRSANVEMKEWKLAKLSGLKSAAAHEDLCSQIEA